MRGDTVCLSWNFYKNTVCLQKALWVGPDLPIKIFVVSLKDYNQHYH